MKNLTNQKGYMNFTVKNKCATRRFNQVQGPAPWRQAGAKCRGRETLFKKKIRQIFEYGVLHYITRRGWAYHFCILQYIGVVVAQLI
jgi:hypothetical protein